MRDRREQGEEKRERSEKRSERRRKKMRDAGEGRGVDGGRRRGKRGRCGTKEREEG
jgi:hypothetical protein